MILGLDASTSVVGWAFQDNGIVKDAGFIDISKLETNKDKSYRVVDVVSKNSNWNGPAPIDHVNLEAPLLGFMGGKTSQQTIVKLIRFNALLEYILGEEWQLPIVLLNVSTMRKKVLGKARMKGITGKEMVKTFLPNVVPNLTSFDKMNTRGTWDAHNEDMYDAIVAALYG